MSILRDLDPKNARFSENTISGKGRTTLWIVPLMLFLAATIWLFFAQQLSKGAISDDIPPISPGAVQDNRSGSIESASRTSIAQSDPVPSTAADAGAAVIRASALSQDEGKGDKSAGGNVFQALQMELEKPQGEQTDAAQKQSSTTEQKKNQGSGKPATAASARKQPANSPAGKSASSANMANNTRKSAERDIDIITAIVK